MRQYLIITSGLIILAIAAVTAAQAAESRFSGDGHVVLDRGAAKLIAEHEYPGHVRGEALRRFPEGSGLAYVVDLRRGHGMEEVDVDARSGRVLGSMPVSPRRATLVTDDDTVAP